VTDILVTPRELLSRPSFRSFLATRFSLALALQIVGVAVGWQVYALTERALDLGLVGAVQFFPQLMLFPFAGALVDRWNRRRALGFVVAIMTMATTALALVSTVAPSREALFACLVIVAVGRTFSGPAAHATLPRLVAREELPVAAGLTSSGFSIAMLSGPALGGLLYAAVGAAGTYAAATLLLLVAAAAWTTLPSMPPTHEVRNGGFTELAAGMRFIFDTPILLGAATLDLFAVLFGGAVALLPIYARDLLHTGPWGLGLLRASPAIGATLMALRLAHRPLQRRVGHTLLAAVAGFGMSTLAFSLCVYAPGGPYAQLAVAMLSLAMVGATDEISVFIRTNIVQLATPDALRGRVSAAEFVFIGASNELGELESGLAAEALGPVRAAALGGFGSLLVVAGAARFAPKLVGLDRFTDLQPANDRSSS
jgi:MFS family permease